MMVRGSRDTGWFKSTHSAANDYSCVEVRLTDTAIGIRDSKNRLGPPFAFASTAWDGLLATVRSGRLDRH
ncbi:MAG: DUF397 domain-containing protein [Sciscionella sp.]